MPDTAPKILRLPQVVARIGLSKNSIYRLIRQGEFPRPLQLTPNTVGWRVDEVDKWADARPRAA